jgi:plastocyanin
METLIVKDRAASRRSARKPLLPLTKWLLATLAAMVVLLIFLQVVVVGGLFPPLAIIFGLPAVIIALLIYAARWRWTPLLGLAYWMLLIALNTSHLAHDIAHPEFLSEFAFTGLVLALTVIGIVTGVGATLQNYRRAAEEMSVGRVPRGFSAMVCGIAGMCLGAVLLAAFVPASASPSVSAQTLASLPALGANHTHFEQTELRAKVGEIVALRLENYESQPHTFNIDELNVHVSMPPGTPSLALFRASTPGTYTFYCDVPGHRQAGMVGTLTIVP